MPLGVLHLPAGGRAVQCRRRHGAGRRRKRARAMPASCGLKALGAAAGVFSGRSSGQSPMWPRQANVMSIEAI